MKLRSIINLAASFLFILFFHSKVKASPLVSETPAISVGSLSCVSISTSAFTLVPSGTAMGGRVGMFINNLSTNTAKMVGTQVNSTDSAPIGSVGEMKVSPSTDMFYLPASDKLNVYLLSLAASAETACIREVKQ